jgi:ribonuclease G
MSKELFVSSTPHETKVAIVEDDQLAEIYYERENEYTLAGSIYKGRVTRVLPGMQSAFVNVGLERDAFLYVSDFLLEEDEDAEGLEQAVSRSRIEVIPQVEQRGEGEAGPLEAQEIMPPIEPAGEEGEEGEEPGEPGGEQAAAGEDQDREGTRKWRGRRRRRGRGGRFPERDAREAREDRPERPAEPAAVEETRVESRPETRFEGRHERRHEPRHEGRAERRLESAPPSGYEPILLPGESIRKYQPHAATPSAPETAQQAPRPQSAARPSTEISIDPSQFSPGSMTLPGESLAKYRGPARPAQKAAAVETPAVTESQEHGFLQDESSTGPIPRSFKAEPPAEAEVEEEAEARVEAPPVIAPMVVRESAPVKEPELEVPVYGHEPEQKLEPKHKEEASRFESMNVASVFGGAAAETEEETQVEEEFSEEPAGHEAEAAGSGISHAPAVDETQPWKAGSGVVEEEEIEEEESDLPEFEEDLDLVDYEELEEEVLGPGNEPMVPMGRELTEAVRDAHINERATGQYEAEGLEAREESEEGMEAGVGIFGLTEEDEEEELEGVEEEGVEETEGPRAEQAGPGAGARQRPERRPERRGRRPGGRRIRGRRPFMQRQLPAISDLLKEGQEILVQIAKEPIAKKGARITSHIALPGRYLVYMPTVHHTGVSRKIASEEERHRLKRIVMSERGEANGGFIVRTAAAGANEDDLRADIRFLINLWTEIRGRAEKAKAPALIYHDLNLVERILRDQVTTSFSTIWVDTEPEYERILRFVSRFQPSLLKRVKLYGKDTPLFEQFNITDEINKALKSKVWLKSGGYIVINQTEALVAIDINTGKYVGKTARLEDTIVKTNIDAIKEIVRQIRLRDLGGIIVIDFIDMDERRNRQKVMQALEEALKADRAPSKVLQFNDFGLVAITRKRVKQSLERTLGQPCPTCQATGMIKSVTTVCNEIYVEMRKMARHFERDVMLRVNPEVAKTLKTNGGKWIQEMEELTKRTILVKSDPLLHPEQFDIQ